MADVGRYVAHGDSVPVNLVSIETCVSMGPGQSVRTAINLPPGATSRSARASAPAASAATRPSRSAARRPAASLPRADASIQMYDYGFRIPKRIDGDGALRIENIGRNEHFIAGIRLNPGVNPAVVRRQLIAGYDFRARRRASSSGHRRRLAEDDQRDPGDLRPGVYLLACFYADRASAGHEHSEFGMVRQVTVR